MRRIRYLIGIVSALILLISGFAPLVSHAAEATQPTISLSSNTNTVKVDDTQTVTMQTHNLPAAAVITIDLPTGLTVDQSKLAEGLDESKVQATVTATQVELKISDQTDSSISLPVVATKAGNYQLQAKVTGTNVTSNSLDLNAETSTDTTTESSSPVAGGSQTTALDGTLVKSARSAISNITSDQTSQKGNPPYVYFYNNNLGITMTGTITDTTAQTLYVGYSIVEKGATAVFKPLTTTKSIKGTTPYSFNIPSSAMPAFNDANYNKIYSFRLTVQDKPIGQSSLNARNITLWLVYVKGTLTMTAPTEINFGTDLDANFTSKPKFMGKIVSGDALSVVDTREMGIPLEDKNGWLVTASLVKQMTGKTSGGVLTDSLHYLHAGNDTVLSSAATAVNNVQHSDKKTYNISGSWNDTEGLAFEPNVGQPQPGESYQGVVQWNLQETPANA